MWFKRVLLGYCAALAVTIVTASSKDATPSKKLHVIERLSIPSLERRQQPIRNQTSTSEVLQSTTGIDTTSSVVAPSEEPHISTTVHISSVITTFEPPATSSPIPTSSSERTESPIGSSSNRDVPSTSSFTNTEVTVVPSFTTEQQPSEVLTQPSPTSLRSEISESLSSSTVLDITSIIPLPTREAQSSSTLVVASSLSGPIAESLSATSQVAASAKFSSSPPVTSSSLSAEETPRPPFATVTSSVGGSASSSFTIQSDRSSVPTPSTQILTSETSSTVASTSTTLTLDPSADTTLVEQQSTTALSPTSSTISTAEPKSTSLVPIPSSFSPESSSLPQEPLPASSLDQTPVSTSTQALPTAGSPVSSNNGATLSTSELQSTTMVMTSSANTGSNSQISSATEETSSLPVASTIKLSPTATLETLSVTEIPSASLVTSIFESSTTPIASLPAPPLSLNSEKPSSSSFAEATRVVSTDLTSLAPSTLLSSQFDVTASSTHTLDPQTSIQVPSSSLLELSSSFIEIPSTSSFAMSPDGTAFPSGTATEAATSLSASPITSSSTTSTQVESLSSANNGPIPSSLNIASSETPNISLPSLSIAPTPLPTTAGSTASIPTPSGSVTTGSIATSELSSALPINDAASSFAPSETLVTSALVSATTSSLAIESAGTSLLPSSLTLAQSGTEPGFSEQLSTTTPILQLPTLSVVASSSEMSDTQSLTSSTVDFVPTSAFFSSTLQISSLVISIMSDSQTFPSPDPTSVVVSSANSTTPGPIPTSEAPGSDSTRASRESSQMPSPTQSGFTSASSGTFMTTSTIASPLPSSIISNGTQTQTSTPITSGMITATFSTVYISSVGSSTARSSAIDLSTVAFSLFSSVTEAALNNTRIRTSRTMLATLSSKVSVTGVPASESLSPSTRLGVGANSTWLSSVRPSLTTTTGLPRGLSSTSTRTSGLGVTFSRSALPTGSSSSTVPRLNETLAETLETSSMHSVVSSTNAGSLTSAAAHSTSSAHSDSPSSTSTSEPDEGSGTDSIRTDVAPDVPTSTPSETIAAGSPPPLTTSQTAGVAVGATTGLLIAVVAAIFLARRYHAAKQGKRLSTGSVYPKVAYLYDPKTGGDGGDAEALMSGATGGMPPGGPASGAAQGSPKHMQRHSTGTVPATRFTNSGHPFRQSSQTLSNSEYARLDTARALSAAVAGYGAASRHSSSYTKYPSDVTRALSDHVIPSPTFAPFSPDDIRRPVPKSVLDGGRDGRGQYSQMPVDSYSYLNMAASMYPPISPYERPATQGPSPLYDTRRQSQETDPFADPFEHDLILQVDERNRTSDSVTVFAGSPNLMSPSTPRTPVGPKMPIRQPSGMTSARSLLSPVAAKYMHKAQEVKIPRKSVASPVLVQVGRSPVIKPFSPPPAAPEHRGWDDIKRHSEKHFSDEQSVPAPLKFTTPVVQRKPVPASHTPMKPSLTGAGQALLAGNGLPLTVNIPHMYKKSVGLDVPRVHGRPDLAHEDVSSDPVVREKRSRELRFADPSLIGKEF